MKELVRGWQLARRLGQSADPEHQLIAAEMFALIRQHVTRRLAEIKAQRPTKRGRTNRTSRKGASE